MKNKLIIGIVSLAVVIVLVGSVLIPIINDSIETEKITIGIEKTKTSSQTTWVVTSDNKLFGCGQNANGQQGDGTTTNVTTFTQRLTDQTVKDVIPTDTMTWTITTDGKLFGCGRNNYGQQGDGTTTTVTEFTQRLTDQTVKDVVCSTYATWTITTDGKLFGCGRNNYSQQGDGTTTDVTEFTQRLTEYGTKTIIKDSPMNSLLETIPLIVIVSIVVMAISLFAIARKE